MKYYTAEEAAKKLKVSAGHIYELVKRGEIKKKEGMGRIVRIPASELKSEDGELGASGWSKFDENKVTLIHTSYGSVRRVIDKRAFVAGDIAKILNKSSAYIIKKLVQEETFIHLELEDAKFYGLQSTIKGIDLITIQGVKEYLEKAILSSNFISKVFIHELLESDKQISIDEIVEEKEIDNNSLRIFEGHQVEIIMENGQPLFELYSTGIALGQADIKNGKAYPKKARIEQNIINSGIELILRSGEKYLTETQLYDFMLEAKTEKCKAFRKWVTNEVLPTIRKTGGYVDNSEKFVDNYFSNLSKSTKETILSELENKNKVLMAERVKIDKELLDNVNVIEKIQETL